MKQCLQTEDKINRAENNPPNKGYCDTHSFRRIYEALCHVQIS